MESAITDEVERIYADDVSGEFESNVRREIIEWIVSTTTPLSGMDIKDVFTMFWNERLN